MWEDDITKDTLNLKLGNFTSKIQERVKRGKSVDKVMAIM